MQKTTLYALTTCTYCQNIKAMLGDCEVDFDCIELDLLFGQERRDKMEELLIFNPARSFPTTIVDNSVIVGYKMQEIKEALGIKSDADILQQQLAKINQKKGLYFNSNRERTFELLKGLQTNKERYGYMACPCRLAEGDREIDKDIICPCAYRQPDIDEFGVCYCGLYVSEKLKDEFVDDIFVPERRTVESKKK